MPECIVFDIEKTFRSKLWKGGFHSSKRLFATAIVVHRKTTAQPSEQIPQICVFPERATSRHLDLLHPTQRNTYGKWCKNLEDCAKHIIFGMKVQRSSCIQSRNDVILTSNSPIITSLWRHIMTFFTSPLTQTIFLVLGTSIIDFMLIFYKISLQYKQVSHHQCCTNGV